MRNILFVSETFLNGGLETRLADEISYYRQHGINIFLATERFAPEHQTLFKDILELPNLAKLTPDGRLDFANLIQNRNLLDAFCQKHSIDCIECHPFWSALPAALVAERLHIKITFTLHGSYSGNFVSYSYPETKLLVYIILKYGFDQIFAVSEHVKNQYLYLSPNILISRNTLNPKIKPKPRKKTSPSGNIAIASRLDQPKSAPILQFITTADSIKSITAIDIFGDGDTKAELESKINASQHHFQVNFHGWQDDLATVLSQKDYDIVLGMGRVILDAISANLPAGLLGYAGFSTFVTPENIYSLAQTNFISWDTNTSLVLPDLFADVQKNPQKYLFKKSDLQPFDSYTSWQTHFKILQDLTPQSKPLIQKLDTLLEEFSKDPVAIGDLIEKFHTMVGLKPDITYDFLLEHYRCTRYYTALRAELDNSITELNLENFELQKQINDIMKSRFWQTTEPIRKLLRKISSKSPKPKSHPSDPQPPQPTLDQPPQPEKQP